MGYHINLQEISLDTFRERLCTTALIPSRRMLRDGVVQKFDQIRNRGINNLKELLDVLKSKPTLLAFSAESGLSEEYLTILNREVKSQLPKPNRFRDFPNVAPEVAEQLERHGIKHTKHLFAEILTPEKRADFANRTGLAPEIVLKLTQLTDLSRIRWVNHTFARVLFRAGYDTAKKVAVANYEEMYETIMKLNREEHLYKGHIGLNDMKMCVEAAQLVDPDIVY